jgi:hypothetical protein
MLRRRRRLKMTENYSKKIMPPTTSPLPYNLPCLPGPDDIALIAGPDGRLGLPGRRGPDPQGPSRTIFL